VSVKNTRNLSPETLHFDLQMHQNAFGGRVPPEPAGEFTALFATPSPYSWIKGEGMERGVGNERGRCKMDGMVRGKGRPHCLKCVDAREGYQWRIQDLPKGPTMASARSASLNGGLGADPPAGPRGRTLGGGQGRPLIELKAFCQFSYKKVAKS